MMTQARAPYTPAYAQTFTLELLARAGIAPGMRVLVPNAAAGELALLVAERVGATGSVFAIDPDVGALDALRESAERQCFECIEFAAQTLAEFHGTAMLDAVVGRFFLMREADPVGALRAAAGALEPGGRLMFQEWHFESVLWSHTSDWPRLPLYQCFARWSVDALRRSGFHVDMGLRLINAFSEAGLPLPSTRSEACAVQGGGETQYTFFEDTLRELLPAIEC
ncbi:MAG: methyltransferase domain-containing protein, partial [Candidatus Eremiobacteraeota bacterium]|nr:methyltransferase domain-containing protein [Candidatus Eremiobacteraeota bacterium]